MGRAGTTALTFIALLAAVALPAAAVGGKPKKGPTVKVADDFFSPTKVTVKPNTQVRFKWLAENTNPHNVTLTKGPKGVSKRQCKTDKGQVPMEDCGTSATGSIGIKFKPVFVKKGTYEFLCTIHPGTMEMKVDVRK